MQHSIILTGGSGFLGKHLCRALAKLGHKIINVDLKDNPEFETVIADIRDARAMESVIQNADTVFHLAALIEAGESVKFPQRFVDVNITGTVNVLEAMKRNGVKNFLFSSSAAIYGEPERVPILEDDRTLPINPYGMTKLAMEGLVQSYVESHGITGVALRYFNLYGPEEHHDPETHAIPRFIQQIKNGEEVTVWGSGEHQRDFIFIDDVVQAHIRALDLVEKQPNRYHYFNISNQSPTAVIDVIKYLEAELQLQANVKHFESRPGDPLVLTADSTKAKEQLDWQATVDIKEGIKRTVEYFQSTQ